jgi:myosin heavy subunit
VLTIHLSVLGEEITRCYTSLQAAEVRDALAKDLYARLFSWLINACNGMLRDDTADLSQGQRCLGILGGLA